MSESSILSNSASGAMKGSRHNLQQKGSQQNMQRPVSADALKRMMLTRKQATLAAANLRGYLFVVRSVTEALLSEFHTSLLSQMMVVKNQIDNKTHRWPNDLEPRGVGGIMSHKLSDPTRTLEHAFKVLYLARSQLLGLYAKHKQDAGLPPYNPPKSMYDLEKLMNTAKEG